MRRVAVFVIAACSFTPKQEGQQSDAPQAGSDAMTGSNDGSVTGDAGSNCYGTGHSIQICLDTAPSGPLALPASPFDTDGTGCTQVSRLAGGPPLCVLAGTTVDVTGTFIATGTRPLVFVATTTMHVSGTIDVSSTFTPARTGAGANDTSCIGPNAGTSDRGGGGGGAGGSFGTAGGNGGTGDENNNGSPIGTAPGGTAHPLVVPTTFRGGCPGGVGGEGDDPNTSEGVNPGGPAGASGGAVYLIAGTSLTIPGSVFASGAGGGTIAGLPGVPGSANCVPGNGGFEQGGGGGGAGGMIGLAAPSVDIPGTIAANGGGGGGGGGCLGGTPGGDGTTALFDQQAGPGIGDHPGSASDGGAGSTNGDTNNQQGGDADGGAGGGGGGLGVVWLDGALTGGAKMSPTPSSH